MTSGVGFAPSATTDTTNANNIGSGTLGVARGGTGLSSLTAHAVLLGEGTSTPGFVAVGTGGRLLIDQGSSADPSFVAMSGDATIGATAALTVAANAITSGKLANAGVSYAKIQNVSPATLLGNPLSSAGAPSEITLIGGASFSGQTLILPSGTVTSVSWTGDGVIFTASADTPITSSGTLSPASLIAQTAHFVLAGPTSAGPTAPTFRAGSCRLAIDRQHGHPIEHYRRLRGTAREFAVSNYRRSTNCLAQGTVLYRGLTGWSALAPGTSGYVFATGGASANPSWVAPSSGSGTVTSVSWTGDGVIFTASADTPVTSSGTLTPASLIAQTANTVFAGPGSAGPTAPTFRALAAADIPVLAASKITSGQLATAQGGTALATIGTASQVLGVNVGATGLEYKSLTAGANVTITPTAGTITIASSGGASGYATVDNQATPLTQRATVNFTGAGVTAVDNSGASRTDVTIPATVTSVTFTGDGVVLSSTPSTAVTTSGTVTASLNTQTAHFVLAGPTSAGPTAPTFRALVAADVPNLAASQITSGQLGVAQGGTAAATLTAHAVLIGEGTSAVAFAAIGTAGRHLVDQGAGADPAFVVISGDATATSAGAFTVTKTNGVAFAASATTDTTNASNIASGTLGVARGGTGLGTLTAHAVMLGEGTSSPGFVTIGTAGRHLVDQGSGADPSFVVISGDATCTSTGAMTVTKTSGVAFAASATTDTTNAENIAQRNASSGPASSPDSQHARRGRKPGGRHVEMDQYHFSGGVPSATQPAFTDISGTAAAAQLPATGLTITQWTGGIGTGSIVSTTATFNLATYNRWALTLVVGTTTLALSNPSVGQQFSILLTQDATTGSDLVTWFSGIKWAGGSAPTLTTTAGKGDLFTFLCVCTGSYWGMIAGQNF